MNHWEYSGQGLRGATAVTFLMWKQIYYCLSKLILKTDFESSVAIYLDPETIT